MRHSLFYPAAVGYAIGVFVASFLFIPLPVAVLALIFSFGAVAAAIHSGVMHSDRELKRYSIFFICCVLIAAASAGLVRYRFFNLDRGDVHLIALAGQHIKAEGIIVEEPDVRDKDTLLTIALDTLSSPENAALIPTKVIAFVSNKSAFAYGDRVSMTGTLQEPQNFQGDNGRVFDYVSYLAKDRIFYQINRPRITTITSGKGNVIKQILFGLKNRFLKALGAVIPRPESDLAAGLLVAGKKALPAEIQDEFQRSGTLQIVVLSGYNVTIVAETLMNVLSFLPEQIAAFFGIGGIIVFTIIAGASATVVRASIMGSIVILAGILRRRYSVVRALVFSGLIMLVANPMLLVFDPSFQLSFTATFGLIVASPLIEKYLLFLPKRFKIRETAVATIATQLFILPLLLYIIGSVSLVAVPANLLIFLFIPLTMLAGFLTGLIALGSVSLALPLGYLSSALLWYELEVVRVFASLPFSLIPVPAFPAWVVALTYAAYALVLWGFYKRPDSNIFRKEPN